METTTPTTGATNVDGVDVEAVLARLEDAATALSSGSWTGVPVVDQAAAVARVQRVAAMLAGVTVTVAGQLARGKVIEQTGWASAKDLLTAVTGGHKGTGPGLVRLAERLEELPETAAALAAGRLSLDKAMVIATLVASLPAHQPARRAAEADLLGSAAVLDATELRRTWPQVLTRIDPDGTLLRTELSLERQERAAYRERRGSFGVNRFGVAWFKVFHTTEDIEIVKQTLLPLSAPQPMQCAGPGCCFDHQCRHDGTDPRDHGARIADALVEACRRLQATDTLPDSHGATPRILVTTHADTLRHQVKAHYGGTLTDDLRLSVAAVRRLACDADIIPVVLGGGSMILDQGRTKRLVTTAIWLMLVLRDRHCAFPGCRRPPIACDAHHITHWADGGTTSLTNLVLLCRRHHTLLHESPWQLRINTPTAPPSSNHHPDPTDHATGSANDHPNHTPPEHPRPPRCHPKPCGGVEARAARARQLCATLRPAGTSGAGG